MQYHHLTEKEQTQVIEDYSINLKTMIELAEKFKVSRQSIFKTLVKAGINTHKGTGGATQITCSCELCGEPVTKQRAYFRKRQHIFCGELCYFAWLKHGNGNPFLVHRQGGRIARAKVAKLFPLQPQHIVHHEDRSQFNNDPPNLKVFANQGDHIRYHRGFIVPILWEG